MVSNIYGLRDPDSIAYKRRIVALRLSRCGQPKYVLPPSHLHGLIRAQRDSNVIAHELHSWLDKARIHK